MRERVVVSGRTRAAQARTTRRVQALITGARDAAGIPLVVEGELAYAGMDVDGPQVVEALAQLVEQTLQTLAAVTEREEVLGVLLGMAQNACVFGWELAQEDPS